MLDVDNNFPDWYGGSFALRLAQSHGPVKRVADIGGGANPLLTDSLIQANGIEYTLLDISQEELGKAPNYQKIQIDATAPLDTFCASVGKERFDLIVTSAFLEHVKDPIRVHENIHAALMPGGLAVHLFPSPNCLPLIVNRLLPELLTYQMLRRSQPNRESNGRHAKFPAYYAMCGAPSVSLHRKYEAIGYEVLQHTGYIGHDYYRPFPVLREIEAVMRPILLKTGIPMISRTILVLRKARNSLTF